MQPSVHSDNFSKFFLRPLAITLMVFAFSLKVGAETLFEGYYKVMLSGVHSGYVIQRYELDAAKKLFTGQYFVYVRTSPDGKQFINESLVAKANDKFQPVSYQYSSLIAAADPTTGKIENRVTTIDATFKGQRMTLKGIKDGKNLAQNSNIPNGVFLSNFLIYLMLQKGFKVGRNFEFNALAEEEGVIHKGTVQIVGEEKYRGVDAYKIRWSYKGLDSVSFISSSGHALATESPAQRAAQELVKAKEEALRDFPVPKQSISKVFGAMPAGNINPFAPQKSGAPATNAPVTTAPPPEVIKPTTESGP